MNTPKQKVWSITFVKNYPGLEQLLREMELHPQEDCGKAGFDRYRMELLVDWLQDHLKDPEELQKTVSE